MVLIIIGIIITALAWLILLVPFFKRRACKLYKETLSAAEIEKYRALAIWESPVQLMDAAFVVRWRLVCIGLSIGIVLGIYLFLTANASVDVSQIERPQFGEGKSTYQLLVSLNGNSYELKVIVDENDPSDDELNAFFDKAAEEAFDIALKYNESAEHIDKDLELIDRLNSGVSINWKISDHSVMNSFGLVRDDIPPEGSSITLTCSLSYGRYSKEYELELVCFPVVKALSEQERLEKYIYENMDQENSYIKLPDSYNGERIEAKTPEDRSYQDILIIAFLLSFILWLLSSDNLDKAYDKRRDELLRDYPGIVSRLSVLLFAGLSVPESLKRLSAEYEKRRERGEPSSAGYEELLFAVSTMQNSGQTIRAINLFGIRCREKQYRNLSGLLISSIQKGSVQVAKQLKEETELAFNMRKENARIAGERAQAKLMIPSFMLFALVIAIVIFPAWSGL